MAPKNKIDHKNQIKDSIGLSLYPGDIILFASCRTAIGYGLCAGVFLDHFDNGSGWKMRIRAAVLEAWTPVYVETADNALIGDDGIAAGVVKISDPNGFKKSLGSESQKIKEAISIRDKLTAEGKFKVMVSQKTSATNNILTPSVQDHFNVEDMLSALSPPSIKEVLP